MRRIVARTLVGVAAAVVVGVVCGGLARLLMRLVTLLAGEEGSFSVAGTLAIIVVYAAFALPGTLLAAFRRGRGRSALLVLGGLALCLPTTAIARSDLEQTLLAGFDIVLVGAAVVGVYVTALALPWVGLAAVRVLDRRSRAVHHASPSSDLSIANR